MRGIFLWLGGQESGGSGRGFSESSKFQKVRCLGCEMRFSRGRELFLGRVFLLIVRVIAIFSAVRSVVSFPEFGWRGERFTFRDDFLA